MSVERPDAAAGAVVSPAGRASSQTLDRGLMLLELISRAKEPVSLAGLSAQIGLHRSIVYRLLRTLQDHNYVAHTSSGYVLGTTAQSLGRRTSPVLQTIARPEVSRLAAAVGLTAFLVVRDQEEAVTLVSVEVQSSRSRSVYSPGDRHPLTLGAPGLAILACDPPRPGEREEIAAAREHGWVSTRGEVKANLATLAAPITTLSGRAIAAVAIIFQVERPGRHEITEVLASARIISGRVRTAETGGAHFLGMT